MKSLNGRHQTDLPLRVLVVGMTNRIGGLETFIMNYCEQLAGANVYFDFLCRFPACSFSSRIIEMGGKIYHITRRSKNPLKFYREIHAFFKKHAMEYDVIWDNECMMNDLTPLLLAARYGIPRRIYHSHNADNVDASWKGRIQGMLHQYHRKRAGRVITDFWACSHEAAQWAFPNAVFERKAYRIIPDAVSTEVFRYDAAVRDECRKALGINDAYVVGNVGHLHHAKNQTFLLDAFTAFRHQYPDALLMLVGEGADRDMLQRKAVTLGIAEAVRFMGHRDDVPRLLQAMDLFVMPSRFEGLGIAAVEAQISGLPCVLSGQLPRIVKFRENVVFTPIDDAQQWSAAMARVRERQGIRTDGCAAARTAGYDIRVEASRLYDLWRS